MDWFRRIMKARDLLELKNALNDYEETVLILENADPDFDREAYSEGLGIDFTDLPVFADEGRLDTSGVYSWDEKNELIQTGATPSWVIRERSLHPTVDPNPCSSCLEWNEGDYCALFKRFASIIDYNWDDPGLPFQQPPNSTCRLYTKKGD